MAMLQISLCHHKSISSQRKENNICRVHSRYVFQWINRWARKPLGTVPFKTSWMKYIYSILLANFSSTEQTICVQIFFLSVLLLFFFSSLVLFKYLVCTHSAIRFALLASFPWPCEFTIFDIIGYDYVFSLCVI